MAASSTLSNFLSFLLPTKPPPPPKLAAATAVVPTPNSTAANGRQSLVATAAQQQQQQQETRFSATATAAAVMCPSMEYVNTLYFRSAYNVQVVVDENESEERLLNRFRREVMRAGVIQECKRRRYHENKQDEAKRRTRDAAKRNRRRRPPPRFALQNKSEVPSSKREDDGDNWDLPEGNLPY